MYIVAMGEYQLQLRNVYDKIYSPDTRILEIMNAGTTLYSLNITKILWVCKLKYI